MDKIKKRVIIGGMVGLLMVMAIIITNIDFGRIVKLANPTPYLQLKECNLGSNIKKIAIGYRSGVILTENGDVYWHSFLAPRNIHDEETEKFEKVEGLSNVKNIYNDYSNNQIRSLLKDGTLAKEIIYLDHNSYEIYKNIKPLSKVKLPEENKKLLEKMQQYNIKEYFYINLLKEQLFFIDNGNTVYNKDFNIIIDGKDFDSDVTSVFEYTGGSKEGKIILKSSKYLYIYDEDGNKIEKAKKYLGINAEDIVQITEINEKETYILTKQENLYKITELYAKAESKTETNKMSIYSIGILALLIAIIVSIIISGYKGRYNIYKAGLKRFMFVGYIAEILITLLLGGRIDVGQLIILFFLNIIIFTTYFMLKRFTWYILRKLDTEDECIYVEIQIILGLLIYMGCKVITSLF